MREERGALRGVRGATAHGRAGAAWTSSGEWSVTLICRKFPTYQSWTKKRGAEPKVRPKRERRARTCARPALVTPMTQLAISGRAPRTEIQDDLRGGAKSTANLSNRYDREETTVLDPPA